MLGSATMKAKKTWIDKMALWVKILATKSQVPDFNPQVPQW